MTYFSSFYLQSLRTSKSSFLQKSKSDPGYRIFCEKYGYAIHRQPL